MRGSDRTEGKDARRTKATRGLTLIELGIVMLLMAILASFSIPRLFMITETNLRTSARLLAETLQLISSMATPQNHVRRLTRCVVSII